MLRYDFSKLNTSTHEDSLYDFRVQLNDSAKANGVYISLASPCSMMNELLMRSNAPVIIIGESDSPLLDAVSRGEAEMAESIRVDFNAFFKVIKSHTGKIRFLFITGCTKLSGLSIFSAMNNLKDLSLRPDYAGMFGYTEKNSLPTSMSISIRSWPFQIVCTKARMSLFPP